MRRLRGGNGIVAGCDEGDFRQVRHLTAGGVGYVDMGVLQEEARGAIEFKQRFLEGGFGGNQVRLAGGQGSGILQDGSLRGEADFELLLIGLEGLTRQIYGRLRLQNRGPVLFYVELRVAHFDAHLVFQLVLANQRLAIFQLGAYLVRLRETIADGNIQRESHSFIGGS